MVPFPIVSTRKFRCNKTINLASPGIGARASAVGARRLNHYAIIYRRMANSRRATKLGVLSVALSPILSFPLNQAFYLCLPCPRIGFQQNVPMVAHSTPIKVPPTSQQIHTQALAENRTNPQQSAHILQPHHSHILNPSHFARVS